MKIYLPVLIAAVTVNCLLAAINGETAGGTLAVPYTDMLLPPIEDKVDISVVAAKVVAAENNVNATTTVKPITNNVHNSSPELSIEALLPPLFEAKSEQNETKEITTKKTTITKTTSTTPPPTTTKSSTTKTTTLKPTLKPLKVEVPDLLLNPLLPPLLDNEIVIKDQVETTTTTEVPLPKTTKKSYHQQQQQIKQLSPHFKNVPSNLNVSELSKKSFDKHVAESKIQIKQVTSSKEKLSSKIESLTKQNVAKQAAQRRTNHKNNKKDNYSFDLYFGSTTPRPIKSGLPTITPFPHRLGR